MPYEVNYDPAATDRQTRVFLQPIAAPSILGLYGLAGATFMVAANMAHWFGNIQSNLTLMPFAAFFGGLAQFLAGMWAFKARDGVATAVHGMWGSFWMAYGILNVIYAVAGGPARMGGFDATAIGFWFVVLAAITWVCMAGAAAESTGLSVVLFFFAIGSTCGAIANFIGSEGVRILAGWLFIIGSIAAWYTASALMLNEAHGRRVWGFGNRRAEPITQGAGEPGVIRGQA